MPGTPKNLRAVTTLQGETRSPGATAVLVLTVDSSGLVMLATGTTVPADGQAGYAKGALFIDTDVADGTSGLYVNVGTTSAVNFDLVTDA